MSKQAGQEHDEALPYKRPAFERTWGAFSAVIVAVNIVIYAVRESEWTFILAASGIFSIALAYFIGGWISGIITAEWLSKPRKEESGAPPRDQNTTGG
jgi:hypothetical protein